MRMLTAIVVGLCIASVMASDVVDAHDADFDSVVESSDLVLMEFYAPWCGHCKTLAPEWESAATALKGSAVLAKLDATVEKVTSEKYGIRGYPSIKVFRDGKLSGDYEGSRNSAGIIKWVKANSGPLVTELTAEGVDAAKKENSVLIALYNVKKGSEEFETFEKVAKALRGQHIFVAVAGSGKASVQVHKQSNGETEEYDGELTNEEAVKKFVTGASIPLFDEIGPENYKGYMDRKLPIVWLFVKPTSPNAQEVKAAAAKIAKDYKGEYSFVWIDAEKYGGMANRLGLSGEKFPAIAIDKEETHFVLEDDISEESFATFVRDFKAGSLKKTVMSEEEPPQGAVQEGLTTVTGKTFEALVLSYDKDVFIEFYAPWCGHCKKLMPVFEKLGKALKDSNVRVAKLDATRNDYNKKVFDVQGFPTLFFVNKATKEIVSFDGDRTFDGMLAFIKKQASSPVDVSASHVDDDL